MSLESSSVARLHAAFHDHHSAVLAYAPYRTASAKEAEEIASATYLSAWRRIRDMPLGPEWLRWLYAVAKFTLANQRRSSI